MSLLRLSNTSINALLFSPSVHDVGQRILITESWTSWQEPVCPPDSTPAQAGTPKAGCPGPCPGSFWVSPMRKAPEIYVLIYVLFKFTLQTGKYCGKQVISTFG